MNILALDPGKSSGWAALINGRRESGVVQFNVERGESKGMLYLKFNAWLNKIFDLTKPELVIYEMAHMRGGAASEILAGMTTRIQEMCEIKHVKFYSKVHSSTIKKFATGSGKASKEDLVKRCIEVFNIQPETDDESDALWMLELGRKKFDGN